jgi:hypothetical protein
MIVVIALLILIAVDEPRQQLPSPSIASQPITIPDFPPAIPITTSEILPANVISTVITVRD